MSILIKGMEMPKAGHWTTICIYNGGTGAEPTWRGVGSNMQVGEAVSVPPHGRLIDADALKLSHCVECTLYPNECLGEDCDWGSIYHIEHAPTIIEAEEEE